MTEYQTEQAFEAVRAAKKAIAERNHNDAHRYARLAIQYDPNLEDSWLVMAATASPRAAVQYLQKALEINPNSTRAMAGMQWALKRQAQHDQDQSPRQIISVSEQQPTEEISQQKPAAELIPEVTDDLPEIAFTQQVIKGDLGKPSSITSGIRFPNIPEKDLTHQKISILPWVLLVVFLCIGLAGVFIVPPLLRASAADLSSTLPAGVYVKPTYTPTPTATFTPTATPTNTPTPTATPTSSPTPYPTDTPLPTPVYVEENYVYEPGELPKVSKKERWIDVDLSSQSVSAYEGKNNVSTFIVSTGTWQHPTVTGQFHIYVKYRYTDMAGPGYYLPDVPYTMYFYDGYGLHGTYWHSNFGTPMSHGCINLRTEDAAWLYNWADVGTLVNVHE
jgi:lipoprotein-anchoring transpeptidase ErfK/SrfK